MSADEPMGPLTGGPPSSPLVPVTTGGESGSASPKPTVDANLQRAFTPDDRIHISEIEEVWLGLDGEGRVAESCLRRRSHPLLKDFPAGNPPAWFGNLFETHGRVLVERATCPQSDTRRRAWFIGDIHGDLVGLLAALDVIRNHTEYSVHDVIVLLGDLIDDLPESELVLAEISDLLRSEERLVIIVGNHDDALGYSEERGFGASVDPCEYCQFLRSVAEGGTGNDSVRFAQSFIRYIQHAPVALFLGDGTFAAHGGVPHTDLLKEVSGPGWGSSHGVWSDFIWARLHPRARSRMAVTGTRSRELGADDFQLFVSTVREHLGFSPVRMIRGHDHIDRRFEVFGGRWLNAVITINNMSWKLPREAGSDAPRDPCIVRWTRGEPLQPIVIRMNPVWRRSMQPEPCA